MWADETLFLEAWEAMLKESIQGQIQKIIVYVDDSLVDSVACAHIVSNLLFQYAIPYSLYTVTGRPDLKKKLSHSFLGETKENARSNTILLLNCGGLEDMSNFINYSTCIRFFIIDSHRPIHHMNLSHSNESVVVFLPNEIDQAVKKILNDIERLELLKRSKNYSEVESSAKFTVIDQLHILFNDYYGLGSYWGTPASFTAYKLANSLNKSRNEDIWLAILGYTEFYLDNRISNQLYLNIYTELVSMISSDFNKESSSVYQGTSRQHYKAISYGRIEPIEDLRLPLLSYWTLYDAVMNSSYVAARLQTWLESGIGAVEIWLAKMGFTPAYSKKNWFCLPPNLKTSLEYSIDKWAKEFNLHDIKFRSFAMSYSYHKKATAFDVVLAITALLNCGSEISRIDDITFSETDMAEKDLYNRESTTNTHLRPIPWKSSKFWSAWRAIESNNEHDFERGIRFAKKIQRYIISETGLAIVRKKIRMIGEIRVYDMSSSDSENNEHFLKTRTGILYKLGRFLQDYIVSKTGKLFPCIVVGPPNAEEYCKLVAVYSQISFDGTCRNFFSLMLSKAAETAKINFRQSSFDRTVIKVKLEDLPVFLHQLNTIIENDEHRNKSFTHES